MKREEKQQAEESREGADLPREVEQDAATKEEANDADEWDGTEDPAFYLKRSDEE